MDREGMERQIEKTVKQSAAIFCLTIIAILIVGMYAVVIAIGG